MAITLKNLWEEGAEQLSLSLITGEDHLDNELPEIAMNRPGLALTGFFQYFANQRLQVFGLAEFTYLESLSRDEVFLRLEGFLDQNVPGIVVTRDLEVTEDVLDLVRRFKVPVFRTPKESMDFVNECTLLLETLIAPRERVQGTMMELQGVGVLLRGEPGIGKSETALSLIERGYSLVSDDVTEIQRNARGQIQCWANEVTRYHMEIRGLGIIHIPSLFGVSAIRRYTELDLIIDLKKMTDSEADTDNLPTSTTIMGKEVPLVTLPVQSGRDMANIVEVAALNQKLKELGHDAAKELDDKVISRLAKRGGRYG